jgi:hypothetical protein
LQYDPDSYDFEAALAAAKPAKQKPGSNPKATAEDAYMSTFVSGELAREVTYGLRSRHRRAAHVRTF